MEHARSGQDDAYYSTSPHLSRLPVLRSVHDPKPNTLSTKPYTLQFVLKDPAFNGSARLWRAFLDWQRAEFLGRRSGMASVKDVRGTYDQAMKVRGPLGLGFSV